MAISGDVHTYAIIDMVVEGDIQEEINNKEEMPNESSEAYRLELKEEANIVEEQEESQTTEVKRNSYMSITKRILNWISNWFKE